MEMNSSQPFNESFKQLDGNISAIMMIKLEARTYTMFKIGKYVLFNSSIIIKKVKRSILDVMSFFFFFSFVFFFFFFATSASNNNSNLRCAILSNRK